MDYTALAKRMLGLGPKGGVSSHAKNRFRPKITPEMRNDAYHMEGWMRSGKTFPLYKKFGSNPKAT